MPVEEESRIPAGYAFFAQFVSHDLTLAPTSPGFCARGSKPPGVATGAPPRLDLTGIYGAGPELQPYLYDQEDRGPNGCVEKFLVGAVSGTGLHDLPRGAQGLALIADARNDENSVVAQVHLAFLLAHNQLVDRARAQGVVHPFRAAASSLRRIYHHLVWHDLVRRLVTREVSSCALFLEATVDGRKRWSLGLSDLADSSLRALPVEFLATLPCWQAMLRRAYQTNAAFCGVNESLPWVEAQGGRAGRSADLQGRTPLRKETVVQWDWFLEMNSSGGRYPQRARKVSPTPDAVQRWQQARAIDRCGWATAQYRPSSSCCAAAPAGSAVAKALGQEPAPAQRCEEELDALWFYVLREASFSPGDAQGDGLGRVGSSIFAAVLAAVLLGDPASFFRCDPCWTPSQDVLLQDGVDNRDAAPDWTLAALIRLAGLPVAAADVSHRA